MIALLSILGLGLIVGRLSRRIGVGAELLLLVLVAGLVVAEYLTWGPGGTGGTPLDLIRDLLPFVP